MNNSSLKIRLQTRDFVALDKPAGLAVHNSEDSENLLEAAGRQLGANKLYPVHRLDKETSGLQILALNERAARDLAEEFQSHRVQKMYLGVLRGVLQPSYGLWSQPLTDRGEGRRNPAGLAKDRVPCETRFKVIRQSKYFSLCEFDLITGRQHQIRKHSALAKQALVGDPRYGDPKYNKKIAQIYQTARMYLHCHKIAIAGYNLISEVPNDFEKLLL